MIIIRQLYDKYSISSRKYIKQRMSDKQYTEYILYNEKYKQLVRN